MTTVVDHARPWFTPRSTFAPIIHDHVGAQITIKGTGTPISHPAVGPTSARIGRRAVLRRGSSVLSLPRTLR